MAVTRFEVTRRAPFAGGREFGAAGAYERIDGVLHFAADPSHPANAAIADLARAARGSGGRVHFDADFCLLQPADPVRGRRTLLFDVLNRGNRMAVRLFNRGVAPLTPADAIDPHDGWLFAHGWTLAWCGWQWDVPRGEVPGLMGIAAPMALEGGRPIPGQVCVEFVPNLPQAVAPLCDPLGLVPFRPYPAADLDDPAAAMFVQEFPGGPRTLVPRERWRFARVENGRVVPDAGHAWLEGGFQPGRIYDIVYRTNHSPVVGAGLLAVRDTAAFLRDPAAAGNPMAGQVDAVLGFGISQSGRFLRTFLGAGLNTSEAGERVFDGLLPHVAGGRRGEYNHRYSQPSVEVTPGFGHLPPFADGGDGAEPGLLAREANVPYVISTNSSSEYWRGDGSLVHIGVSGQRDLALPPASRVYLFAGTPHGPGFLPFMSESPLGDGTRGVHDFNVADYRPLLRAALVNLEAWVKDGIAPPPSAVPRLDDGTAVARAAALAALPAIPGLVLPDVAALRSVPLGLDLGPGQAEGIGCWPAASDGAYPCFVSATDADGNEIAGIRLPDISEPVATYLGWNPRHPETGGEGQVLRYIGSTFPFARDAVAREAAGDPRPSLAERYRERFAYEERVRAAAKGLAAARHLLEEDIEIAVTNALRRYDAVVARGT